MPVLSWIWFDAATEPVAVPSKRIPMSFAVSSLWRIVTLVEKYDHTPNERLCEIRLRSTMSSPPRVMKTPAMCAACACEIVRLRSVTKCAPRSSTVCW